MIIAGLKVVDENFNNWITFCPFHKDTKTPNFYIVKSGKYAGHYKCFACGKYGHISELDKTIKVDKMSTEKVNNIKVDWESLNQEYLTGLLPFNGRESLPEILNVPKKILTIYDCGWDGECYTFPLRDDMNRIIGIQRRFPNSTKRSVSGSKAGLFLPQGVNFIRGSTVYVCEGLSDTATCMSLGYFAIGRMSATTGTRLLCKLLKGKNIVVIGDNDVAGIDASTKLVTKLKRHSCNVIGVTVPNHKDLREFYEKEPEKAKEWLKKLDNMI